MQFYKDLNGVIEYHCTHGNCQHSLDWYKPYMQQLYQKMPETWGEFKMIRLNYTQVAKCGLDEELFGICLSYNQILKSKVVFTFIVG